MRPLLLSLALCCGVTPALCQAQEQTILPSRPIPAGKAPHMQVKVVKDTPEETVYAVIFLKGDEALSGMVDFANKYHVQDGHFTAIGAVSSATLGYLDLSRKIYLAIPVKEQVEVASLIGDISTFNDKAVIHMHCVLGKRDGSTVAGHIWELNVNPTLEVMVTVNNTPLKRRPDDASGMKIIDPSIKD